MKFSELLRKIARLIVPKNKQQQDDGRPHYIRDQKQVDAHLARMGHQIERRNQHIPVVRSLADLFKQDTDRTEAAYNRRLGIWRGVETNSDMLGQTTK